MIRGYHYFRKHPHRTHKLPSAKVCFQDQFLLGLLALQKKCYRLTGGDVAGSWASCPVWVPVCLVSFSASENLQRIGMLGGVTRRTPSSNDVTGIVQYNVWQDKFFFHSFRIIVDLTSIPLVPGKIWHPGHIASVEYCQWSQTLGADMCLAAPWLWTVCLSAER